MHSMQFSLIKAFATLSFYIFWAFTNNTVYLLWYLVVVTFTSLSSTAEAAPERRGRQGQSVCAHRFIEGRTPQQEHRAGGEGASVQAAAVRTLRGWTETRQGPGKCCSASDSASSTGKKNIYMYIFFPPNKYLSLNLWLKMKLEESPN